jgi:hypothetical protein
MQITLVSCEWLLVRAVIISNSNPIANSHANAIFTISCLASIKSSRLSHRWSDGTTVTSMCCRFRASGRRRSSSFTDDVLTAASRNWRQDQSRTSRDLSISGSAIKSSLSNAPPHPHRMATIVTTVSAPQSLRAKQCHHRLNPPTVSGTMTVPRSGLLPLLRYVSVTL